MENNNDCSCGLCLGGAAPSAPQPARVNHFPPLAAEDKGVTAFTGAITYPPVTPAQLQGYTPKEQEVLVCAVDSGLQFADSAAILRMVKALMGDINRAPLMWMMETEAGAVSHTHYRTVAEEYSKRPAYTVSPVYPRRGKKS